MFGLSAPQSPIENGNLTWTENPSRLDYAGLNAIISSVEANIALYNKLWSSRGWRGAIRFGPANRMRHRQLSAAVAPKLREGVKVCDFGCGDGTLLGILQAESGANPQQLFGCDLSAEAAQSRATDFQFFQGDLSAEGFALPFRADLGVCSEVLEHVPNPATALASIFRSLNPGATLYLSVPAGPIFSFDRRLGHLRHFHSTDLKSLLKDAGFDQIVIHRHGFPFHCIYKCLVHFFPESRQASWMEMRPKSPLAKVSLALLYALLLLSRLPGWQIYAEAKKPQSAL
jgi:SAM-dependent methyltransferase